jgi:oxygen tolerance protein BatD
LVTLFKISLILLLVLPAAVFAQDDYSITMTVSPDKLGLYDQATLVIEVSGPQQNLPKPNMPNLSMFESYSQGTSTNISIMNGQVMASLRYQYLLQPKRKGVFVIKPATLVVDRKRYLSNEVTLTVIDQGQATSQQAQAESKTSGGKRRDIFLTAEVDKKKPYVNEQVTLRIKFYHTVRLYTQPEYASPQTTDFWADMLEPQKTYYETVDGKQYRVIEINSALFPTRSGKLTIGEAEVKASVPVSRRQRNDPFSAFNNFFDRGVPKTVKSKPLTIEVLPLPEEAKPSGFTGTVGKFTLRATHDKTSVEVNEPVTVTYKISGTGNIKTIAEPQIGELDDFRVYRASSSEKISKLNDILGGTKIFEEVFIPRRSGKLTIPAVSLDFFDPKTKKYQTLSTKPIILNISQAEIDEDYVSTTPFGSVSGRVIDPNAKGIRYIKTSSGILEKEKPILLKTPFYLALNGVPVLLLLIVIIAGRFRDKLATDVGYARSRIARKMARKRLTAAKKLAGSGKADAFYAEIRQAIFSYIADKMNISSHGLTGDSLIDILKDAGVGDDDIERTREILRQADFAQYSSANLPPEKTSEALIEAEKLLVTLEGARFE